MSFPLGSPPGRPAAHRSALRAFARGFSSLSNPNYRLYYSGQLISLVGTWMQRLAQDWLVLKLTNSPLDLGIVSMLQFLPITIFSLYGGVIADRFPKRNLLLVTQAVSTVQAVALAALTSLGMINFWEICLLAVVLGLVNALDNPARQAFPVELVGRDEVANAVALNSSLFNTSRIIGPSLAGVAIATIGVAGCFWLNAISFFGAIGSLVLMDPSRFFAVPSRQIGSARRLLAEGLAYAWRTPSVRVMFISMVFIGTFGYNFLTLLPLIARYVLHTNSFGYGFLFTGLGGGSLVAALFLAFSRTHGARTVFIGGFAFIASLAGLGLTHHYLLSLSLLTLVGAFSVVYSTATQTRLQVLAPDELRGRVMSLYTLVFAGSTPFGSLLVGGVSDRWSVESAIELCAAASVIGIVLALMYALHRRHARAQAALLPARLPSGAGRAEFGDD